MSDTSAIRVLIIDDHPVVRVGLRMLITVKSELVVVGEAGNRAEALAAVRQQVDVIVLDLDLGCDQGLDLIPELLAASPRARILVLTGVRDAKTHAAAIDLGAKGLMLKEDAPQKIIEAIESVHAGNTWFGSSITDKMRANARENLTQHDTETAKIASLTKREREIVALVSEGLKNQQIANRLFISEGTVRNHLTVIFDKLGVANRFALIVYASRHDLISLPR